MSKFGVDYRQLNRKGIVSADGFNTTVTKITFNPPELETGESAVSSALDVAGVKVGDGIKLFPPYSTQGIMYQGIASADGKILISLFNPTAGTVDLAEGQWGVAIERGV